MSAARPAGLVEEALRSLLITALGVMVGLTDAAAASTDGRWQLSISGHYTFVFGDRELTSGLRIPWESEIEFSIRDGHYELGYGRSRWLPPATSVSHPAGWFSCALSAGTFLDRSLRMQETPWVRYPAFPVAGALENGLITLKPDVQPPGNYLALTYHCESDEPIAHEWFMFAARGRQEEGRRQDAVTQQRDTHRSAENKEVRPIPPRGAMELPLRDGWLFKEGDAQALDSVTYQLRRLPD